MKGPKGRWPFAQIRLSKIY